MAGSTAVVVIMKDGKIFCVSYANTLNFNFLCVLLEITAISIKVVLKTGEKVEYERERLIGKD